jgi:hypothetical protein
MRDNIIKHLLATCLLLAGTAADNHWNNDHLVGELSQVKGSNFEVVKMVGIVTP